MKGTWIAVVCAAGLILMGVASRPGLLGSSEVAAQETSSPQASPSKAAGQNPQVGSVPGYAEITEIISKYHCTVCHGGAEPRVGLSMDDYKSLMKGSKRGPVIIPGDSAKSELIRRFKGTSEPRMPFTGPPWLSDTEVVAIERWISRRGERIVVGRKGVTIMSYPTLKITEKAQ